MTEAALVLKLLQFSCISSIAADSTRREAFAISVDFLISSLAFQAAQIPNLSRSVIAVLSSLLEGKNSNKTKMDSGYSHRFKSLRKKDVMKILLFILAYTLCQQLASALRQRSVIPIDLFQVFASRPSFPRTDTLLRQQFTTTREGSEVGTLSARDSLEAIRDYIIFRNIVKGRSFEIV